MGDILSLAELTELAFKDLYIELDIANAPEKRKAEIIDSLWKDIYKQVFKPTNDDVLRNNCKSKLKPWDTDEVEEVVDTFVKLNKRYGGVIKYNQFANLTGIHRSTLWVWNKSNNTNGYIFNLSNNALSEERNTIIYILKDNNNVDVVYNGNSKYINGVNYTDIGNTEYLSTKRYDVIKKLQEEMQDSNTNGLSNDTMGHAIRANHEKELGKLYEHERMIQQVQARAALTAADLPIYDTELSDNMAQIPEMQTVKSPVELCVKHDNLENQ